MSTKFGMGYEPNRKMEKIQIRVFFRMGVRDNWSDGKIPGSGFFPIGSPKGKEKWNRLEVENSLLSEC